MPKPHLVVSRVPLFGPWPVKALCGAEIEQPQYVPAFDAGELPSVTPGTFHPKCEKKFSETKWSGEVLIYAVTQYRERE